MDLFSQDDLKLVSSHLNDDASKYLFENYMMWNITKDYFYIKNVVCSSEIGAKIASKINSCEKAIGVFGAGAIGKYIGGMFTDKVTCFIDNNKTGTVVGKQILSLTEYLEKYPEGVIVIATKYYKEIGKQLKDLQITNEIIDVGEAYYEKLAMKQYFDLPDLNECLCENEVFVDGGAYDGQTTLNYYELLNQKGIKNGFSYIWEPDQENVEKIKRKLSQVSCERFEIVEKGLWNSRAKLSFGAEGTTGSRIDESGTGIVEVDSIDSICTRKPTFIKMDVEGAELNAIDGARKVITGYKPKLAICIYHKPDDFITIPKKVLEMNPDYRLYIRHYSLSGGETVLYAI